MAIVRLTMASPMPTTIARVSGRPWVPFHANTPVAPQAKPCKQAPIQATVVQSIICFSYHISPSTSPVTPDVQEVVVPTRANPGRLRGPFGATLQPLLSFLNPRYGTLGSAYRLVRES